MKTEKLNSALKRKSCYLKMCEDADSQTCKFLNKNSNQFNNEKHQQTGLTFRDQLQLTENRKKWKFESQLFDDGICLSARVR